MGSIGDVDERQYYPPRQQDQPYIPNLNHGLPTIHLETNMLIVGGGPVGMYLALMLAHHGQACTIIEQYKDTTIYPKMEFTNGRSMEMLRQMGIAGQLRAIGVPENYDLDEIITTGLGAGGRKIATWQRDSPDEIWRKMKEQNNGSWEREPYVRCPQALVEEWLKSIVVKTESIQSHWGWKFIEVENDTSLFFDPSTGQEMKVKSRYVVGCDGGGSRVRKSAGLESKRRSLDLHFIFIHCRSSDLDLLFSQGHYWHANGLNGGVIVNQDEKGTFTIHTLVPPGAELSSLKTSELVNRAVGGLHGPTPVKIDELICRGEWKAQVAIADNFTSESGKIFLAGDAAHQLSPVGGHGLNSGMGDVWDLSWKLAAVMEGWGGEGLLRSYDIERRPVAFNNLSMVEKGIYDVLLPMYASAATTGGELLTADTIEGENARHALEEQVQKCHWLNYQNGTSMGFRYKDSPIVVHDGGEEPVYEVEMYVPSSFPGARAPHVFLKDGSSIFDHFSPEFNVVDFSQHGQLSDIFCLVGEKLRIPIRRIHLPDESHAKRIWEREVVLVRPDGHIAWRRPESGQISAEEVKSVLELVSGRKP